MRCNDQLEFLSVFDIHQRRDDGGLGRHLDFTWCSYHWDPNRRLYSRFFQVQSKVYFIDINFSFYVICNRFAYLIKFKYSHHLRAVHHVHRKYAQLLLTQRYVSKSSLKVTRRRLTPTGRWKNKRDTFPTTIAGNFQGNDSNSVGFISYR